MDSAVVGFMVAGDPLLDDGLLRVAEGLNVVYGLNGAGKTRVLAGIRDALLGCRSEVAISLICTLHEPSAADIASEDIYRRLRPSGSGLILALARALATEQADFDAREYVEDQDFPTVTIGRGFELASQWIGTISHTADPEAEQAIDSARLVALIPTGTSSMPSWDAWAVADMSVPAIAAEVEWIRAAEESGEDEEWQDAYERSNLRHPANQALVTRDGLGHGIAGVAPLSFYSEVSLEPGVQLNGPIDFGLELMIVGDDPDLETREYLQDLVALGAASAIRVGAAPTELPSAKKLISNYRASYDYRAVAARWLEVDPAAEDDRADRVKAVVRAAEHVALEAARELSEIANQRMQLMMVDAPELELSVARPTARLLQHPFEWTFQHEQRSSRVRFDQLSRAEAAWAQWAIAEALLWHRRTRESTPASRLILNLFDEPESALHRSAERHMARGLTALAAEGNRVVFAATHSPLLIDAPRASIIEVKRGAGEWGRSIVQPLGATSREGLEELGLLPSDLLNRTKVFLLVEGAHDELLFQAWFGRRLEAASVRILPMRGAQKLPGTIDTRVLFDFTDAHLVALLDNLDPAEVRDTWEMAQRVRITNGTADAKSVVLDGLRGDDEEARNLREWLTAALDRGLDGRITPMSLSAGDIIEYVHCKELVPESTSWVQLRADFEAARAASPKRRPPFKEWLKQKYALEVTPELLRAAALASPIPREFEDVMNALEAISDASWDRAQDRSVELDDSSS